MEWQSNQVSVQTGLASVGVELLRIKGGTTAAELSEEEL